MGRVVGQAIELQSRFASGGDVVVNIVHRVKLAVFSGGFLDNVTRKIAMGMGTTHINVVLLAPDHSCSEQHRGEQQISLHFSFDYFMIFVFVSFKNLTG